MELVRRSDPLRDGSRTLVVNMLGLGDVVMATPALRGLRAALPNSPLGLLCRRGFADLFEPLPCLDEVIGFDVSGHRWASEGKRRRLSRRIREHGYERVLFLDRNPRVRRALPESGVAPEQCILRVSPTGDHRTLASGEWDTALRRSNFDEQGRPVHITDQYLAFVEQLCGGPVVREAPALVVPPEDRGRATELLDAAGVSDGVGFWVLHIGLSTLRRGFWRRRKPIHRAWPLERWVTVIEKTLEERDAALVLTGTPSERRIHQCLRSRIRPGLRERLVDLSGRTQPRVLAGVLAAADGYVGVETGPMHVAGAVGTPIVALYGPTDPRICGSRGDTVSVVSRPTPCSPCIRAVRKRCKDNVCMQAIEPDDVTSTLRRIPPRPAQATGARDFLVT